MKKYELTSVTKKIYGRTFFRIRAIKNFGNVKVGDLGGYIENENNLSHSDNAWVFNDAKIFDNVRVFGDARVFGNADVYEDNHILQIGSIGSRGGITTFFRTKDKEIFVNCGCFMDIINEFEKAVIEKHKGTNHEKTYLCAIELAKLQIDMN